MQTTTGLRRDGEAFGALRQGVAAIADGNFPLEPIAHRSVPGAPHRADQRTCASVANAILADFPTDRFVDDLPGRVKASCDAAAVQGVQIDNRIELSQGTCRSGSMFDNIRFEYYKSANPAGSHAQTAGRRFHRGFILRKSATPPEI